MAVTMVALKNRQEWLENRKCGIGGSDASSILGLNPWKTNVELFNEFTRTDKVKEITNDAMEYGTKAEEYLRKLFELDYPEYKMHYKENNSWRNDKYPFALASLDGWLTDSQNRKGIWECKTTEIIKKEQWKKWDNQIPTNYYVQVLHYLLVTEFDFAILKAQIKTKIGNDVKLTTKHYFIERSDVESDIEYLAKQEQDFWECVKQNKKPALILPAI